MSDDRMTSTRAVTYYERQNEGSKGRADHKRLEADKIEVGERVARALWKENRTGGRGRRERQNTVVARCGAAGHAIFGARAAKPVRRHTSSERRKKVERLIRRDGDLCWYCQRPFRGRLRRTIDHIIPISKRGSNVLANLRLACQDCNGYRKNREAVTAKGAFRKLMAERDKQDKERKGVA